MKPITIVAIEFSPADIHSLLTFFDYTPLDHTAYIVLSHLTAKSKTDLQAILSKHSSLLILDAVTGETLERDKVYLIGEGESLTVSRKNQLTIHQQTMLSSHATLELFLDSLAKNKQSKIALVLLSASGDVIAGMLAIKAAGGIVLAQTAVPSIEPDYILKPEEMPAMLTRWTENKWMPLPISAHKPAVNKKHQEHFLRQIGSSIKQQREKLHITQQGLADICQMQKASVSRIEAGKSNLTMFSMHRLASALGVEVADFF